MGTPDLEGKSKGLVLEVPSYIEAHRSEAVKELLTNLVAEQELHIAAKVELRIELKGAHNLVDVEDNHTVAIEVAYRSLVVDSYQTLILLLLKTELLILSWEEAIQELHNRFEQGMAELAIH